MTTKLDLPTLSGTLEASTISNWLNLCDDSFQAFSLMNPTRTVDDSLRILLAGLKMESPAAATWWSENRDSLKALTTWSAFSAAVKDRFVPANWRMDALISFYAISQGSGSYPDFVSRLQMARNTLASAGKGFAIHDTVMKNHLLFYSNRILCLRVCAIPSLDFGNLKSDALIGIMSSSWNSMVAEGIVTASQSRPPTSFVPSTTSRSQSFASSSSRSPSTYPLPDLSYAERENLRSVGGCFHCRLTFVSTGWKNHSARNCPGDKSRNIPPRAPLAMHAISSVLPEVTDESTLVSAILPSTQSFVLGNGTDSESEDDY
jgi:hypothetical protein